jgi:hypothetical protein
MDKENFKTILLLLVMVAAILGLNFLVQKNADNKKETVVPEKPMEKILTPKEVVTGYIEADMAGALLGADISKKAPGIAQYYELSSGGHSDFAQIGSDHFMVIKNYEIVSENQSKNINTYYVKVNYYCDGEVFGGSMGLKNEKVLVKNKNGEAGPVEINCSDYFIKLACSDCYDENNPTIKEFSFDDKTNIETVNFELIKDGQTWKLKSPRINPHISLNTLDEYLKDINETDK